MDARPFNPNELGGIYACEAKIWVKLTEVHVVKSLADTVLAGYCEVYRRRPMYKDDVYWKVYYVALFDETFNPIGYINPNEKINSQSKICVSV